jgi:hypothetical protein
MFIKLMRLLAGIGMLALTACSGMVLGGQASCTGSTLMLTQVTGECSRTIEELSETANEGLGVQTADVAPFTTVDYVVTVESGRVAVTFTDFHGNKQTDEATSTSPVTGSVRVQLDPLNRINFSLEPLDGPAEGVEYKLKFVCDCMP